MKKIFFVSIIISILAVSGFFFRQYWVTYDTPEYEHLWGWFPTTTFIPLWERKVETQQVLKIGMITDTHVHPNRIDRQDKRDEAPRHLGSMKDKHPLELFNAQMKHFGPDVVIHAGDVIEGTNDEDFVGRMGLSLVQEELEKSGVPVYWVIGNHDLRSVNKEQFAQTLAVVSDYHYADKVVDLGDYRIILLDGNYYPDGRDVEPGGKRHIPGYLHPKTLAWLERQLDTEKYVFVVMHQGAFNAVVRQGETADADALADRIEDTKIAQKVRKQGTKGKASITNAAAFRALLEKYNVTAFINGHLEVARYDEIGGVRYYSLTGTKKSIVLPESFYELVIDAGVPRMQMYYTDAAERVQKNVPFEETYRVH